MELTKLHQHIENLPKEQANAILGIMDMKTEENMEKVLAKFDSFEKQMKMLLWFMGIGFTGLGILITVLSVIK